MIRVGIAPLMTHKEGGCRPARELNEPKGGLVEETHEVCYKMNHSYNTSSSPTPTNYPPTHSTGLVIPCCFRTWPPHTILFCVNQSPSTADCYCESLFHHHWCPPHTTLAATTATSTGESKHTNNTTNVDPQSTTTSTQATACNADPQCQIDWSLHHLMHNVNINATYAVFIPANGCIVGCRLFLLLCGPAYSEN